MMLKFDIALRFTCRVVRYSGESPPSPPAATTTAPVPLVLPVGLVVGSDVGSERASRSTPALEATLASRAAWEESGDLAGDPRLAFGRSKIAKVRSGKPAYEYNMMIESSESISVMPTVNRSCVNADRSFRVSGTGTGCMGMGNRDSGIRTEQNRLGDPAGRTDTHWEDDDVSGVDLSPVGVAFRDR